MVSQAFMKAVQLSQAGPSSNLRIVNVPIPQPQPGQVLIRVKAFGLNRSELLTRQFGRAPIGPVQLPRILGIEAVGTVESAPGNEFSPGTTVMTALGGMGIASDGSYAELTCVSVQDVRTFSSKLGWDILGAIPEMMQTAHGCLFRSLKLRNTDKILIRGGTTSIGLAAASLAKEHGCVVLASTRKTDSKTVAILKSAGVDHVIIDAGSGVVQEQVNKVCDGVDKVLDLIGGSALPESISCLNRAGICCSVGIVGGELEVAGFNPLAMIPTERYLTGYAERTFTAKNFPLDEILQKVENGSIKIPIAKVFKLDDIVQAHEFLESNQANGKVVVVI